MRPGLPLESRLRRLDRPLWNAAAPRHLPHGATPELVRWFPARLVKPHLAAAAGSPTPAAPAISPAARAAPAPAAVVPAAAEPTAADGDARRWAERSALGILVGAPGVANPGRGSVRAAAGVGGVSPRPGAAILGA